MRATPTVMLIGAGLRFAGHTEQKMNSEEITHQLLRRYAAAQHPLGRFLLNQHVRGQRWRAKWRSHGAEVVKRGFDIVISLIVLILVSPLLLLIALLVKLEDGGPVF